jgi:hypothetical protein
MMILRRTGMVRGRAAVVLVSWTLDTSATTYLLLRLVRPRHSKFFKLGLNLRGPEQSDSLDHLLLGR